MKRFLRWLPAVLLPAAPLLASACAQVLGLNQFTDGACTPGATAECPYHGAKGTKDVGACRAAQKVCNADGQWGECDGTEIDPVAEVCANKTDDDCDGTVNNGCPCIPGENQPCYDGPPGTEDQGICHGGMKTCNSDGETFGACAGQQGPLAAEDCSNNTDDDCNGQVNDGCPCTPGTMSPCYDGPMGTETNGTCHAGMHTCNPDGVTYSACSGEQLPGMDTCGSTPVDGDCDGFTCGQAEVAADGGGGTDVYVAGIATDSAGNVYLTGSITGGVQIGSTNLISAGQRDILVAKFDPTGKPLWAKQFGDANDQYGNAIAVDSGGNVVVTGLSYSAVDFGGGTVATGIFIAKLDTDGNHAWSLSCGGGTSTYSIGTGVGTDAQNNVFVTGWFSNTANCGLGTMTSAGLRDIFLVKLAGSNGHALWQKRFGDAQYQSANALTVDSGGNVIIAGTFQGTLDLGGIQLIEAGGGDAFTAKFTSSGMYSAANRWGDASSQEVNSVAVDSLGNLLVVGDFAGSIQFGTSTLTSAGSDDVFAAEINPLGNAIWSKRYGDNALQLGTKAAIDSQGNALIAASTNGTINLGGSPFTGSGSVVGKFDKQGTHVWSRGFVGSAGGTIGGLALGPAGEVIVAGTFNTSFDYGTGMLTSSDTTSLFLVKLAP